MWKYFSAVYLISYIVSQTQPGPHCSSHTGGRAMQCQGPSFLPDNHSCYCENRKGSRKAKVALYVTDALAGNISLAAQKRGLWVGLKEYSFVFQIYAKKKCLENDHIYSGQGKNTFWGKIKISMGSSLFVCLGGVSSTNLIESRLGAGGKPRQLWVIQVCSPEASKSHPGT